MKGGCFPFWQDQVTSDMDVELEVGAQGVDG